MKLICKGQPDNWLEFTDNITQRQRREYGEAVIADNVKAAIDDDNEQAAKAASEANSKTIERILREVVTDGVLIIGGEKVRGIDAILSADPEDFTITAAAFFGSAFFEAVGALRRLGKPIESA